MDTILKAENLTKKYFTKRALNSMSLEVKKGKIVGLLGSNGSGKTTFMNICAGLVKPSSGSILIDGKKPGIYTKSIVSYLPDKSYLYKWMKIKNAVKFYKDFYKDFDAEKCKKMLGFMKLNEEESVTSLSKGMTEKLNLTLTLSRKAKLYILDEPLGGVDPSARQKILDAIIENYTENSSMIISTQIVNDIERIFDDVVFISKGEIVLYGEAEQLRQEKGKSIDELFMEVFE